MHGCKVEHMAGAAPSHRCPDNQQGQVQMNQELGSRQSGLCTLQDGALEGAHPHEGVVVLAAQG